MNDVTADPAREWHERFAVGLFNLVWDLLDKPDRSADDDSRMLNAAHASRFHWGEIGTPLEFQRGEWQISRVYSVLKSPEGALRHARRCLEISREHGIGDFDLAFAYEAMARAHAVASNPGESLGYLQLAEEAGAGIGDSGNRDYFLGELKTVRGLPG